MHVCVCNHLCTCMDQAHSILRVRVPSAYGVLMVYSRRTRGVLAAYSRRTGARAGCSCAHFGPKPRANHRRTDERCCP